MLSGIEGLRDIGNAASTSMSVCSSGDEGSREMSGPGLSFPLGEGGDGSWFADSGVGGLRGVGECGMPFSGNDDDSGGGVGGCKGSSSYLPDVAEDIEDLRDFDGEDCSSMS